MIKMNFGVTPQNTVQNCRVVTGRCSNIAVKTRIYVARAESNHMRLISTAWAVGNSQRHPLM